MTTRPVSGPVPQGVDEAIAYKFDFSDVAETEGSATGTPTCTLYNKKTRSFQSALLSGAASLSGNIATSNVVSRLENGTAYILSVAVTFTSGNVISATLTLRGEY